jgi:glycosyltransferase involved in cell wall biosynthesis
MKILFVTSVPLLPTNDGIRIPAANHFYALAQGFDVDLLVLDPDCHPAEASELEATQSLVTRSAVVSVKRVHKQKAIFRELIHAEPFFGAFEFSEALPGWALSEAYDCVWCATAPAAGIFALARTRLNFNVNRFVAGLSDMHSLVVLRQATEASKSGSIYYKTITRAKLWLRSRILLRSEGAMLNRFDLVTMQTQKEFEWVQRHFGGVAQKSLILSNGVSPTLFDVPIERKTPSLLFVGALHGVYGQRLQWFIQNVWPSVRCRHSGASLHVVGKGASSELRAIFEKETIVYKSYVESIEDEYARHAILIAPIFKGFGLINKVVEAMAAGCLVIGDVTAFNGIESFVSDRHGRVANDVESFIEQALSVLKSEDFCQNERFRARYLINEKFNWITRYASIQKSVLGICEET